MVEILADSPESRMRQCRIKVFTETTYDEEDKAR